MESIICTLRDSWDMVAYCIHESEKQRVMADAQLIAAALDLLAACKMALQPSNDLDFGTQEAMLIAIARTKGSLPASVDLRDACRAIIEAPTPEVLDIGVLRSAKSCLMGVEENAHAPSGASPDSEN